MNTTTWEGKLTEIGGFHCLPPEGIPCENISKQRTAKTKTDCRIWNNLTDNKAGTWAALGKLRIHYLTFITDSITILNIDSFELKEKHTVQDLQYIQEFADQEDRFICKIKSEFL